MPPSHKQSTSTAQQKATANATEREVLGTLAHDAPEGAPPTQRLRKREIGIVLPALGLLALAIVVGAWIYGGAGAAAAAAGIAILSMGIAYWPVWHATADRYAEEAEVRDEVDHSRPPAPPA